MKSASYIAVLGQHSQQKDGIERQPGTTAEKVSYSDTELTKLFLYGILFAILMRLKFMQVLIASIKAIMVGLPPEA